MESRDQFENHKEHQHDKPVERPVEGPVEGPREGSTSNMVNNMAENTVDSSEDQLQGPGDNSDWFFYFLVFLIAIYIFIKTVQWPSEKHINVQVLKQDGSIENINTTPKPQTSANFWVDTIHFPEGDYLYHHNLGYTEFSQDFFMKLQTQMQVHQAGQYRFSIRSDDGFILSINEKKICEFPHGRPFQETFCSVYLDAGVHHFEIYYYQGFGYLGLEAKYERAHQADLNIMTDKPSLNMHFIGRNSDAVSFIPMPTERWYAHQ